MTSDGEGSHGLQSTDCNFFIWPEGCGFSRSFNVVATIDHTAPIPMYA